jgi:hypothetical protein
MMMSVGWYFWQPVTEDGNKREDVCCCGRWSRIPMIECADVDDDDVQQQMTSLITIHKTKKKEILDTALLSLSSSYSPSAAVQLSHRLLREDTFYYCQGTVSVSAVVVLSWKSLSHTKFHAVEAKPEKVVLAGSSEREKKTTTSSVWFSRMASTC